MSKETQLALDCPGCGERVLYREYHIPHCDGYQRYLIEATKAEREEREKRSHGKRRNR